MGKIAFLISLDPPNAPDQLSGGWTRIPGRRHCHLPGALCRNLLLCIIRVRLLGGMDLTSDVTGCLIGF